MIKSIPFANAAAVVAVGLSFICWVLTLVAPDFVFGIASSWSHMINFDVVRMNSTASFGEALIGFISLGVVVWAWRLLLMNNESLVCSSVVPEMLILLPLKIAGISTLIGGGILSGGRVVNS